MMDNPSIKKTEAVDTAQDDKAPCLCIYMECGKKFQGLKALDLHVRTFHNISWTQYTSYYHSWLQSPATPMDYNQKHHSPISKKVGFSTIISNDKKDERSSASTNNSQDSIFERPRTNSLGSQSKAFVSPQTQETKIDDETERQRANSLSGGKLSAQRAISAKRTTFAKNVTEHTVPAGKDTFLLCEFKTYGNCDL